jgi:L-lactate dehydrogenase complex protein LldF
MADGTYRHRAAREIEKRSPATTTGPIMRKLVNDSAAMLRRSPEDAKARATAARQYAIGHLDDLHNEFRKEATRRGTVYHRATTGDDAVEIIKKLLGDAKRVAKSKTMVGEEVGLTHALRDAGMDVLETDIGEYIVDIEGRGPSHITAPALHLNRTRIQELLVRAGADLDTDDPTVLSRYVRDVVGGFFKECDAAITGTNMAVASSGRMMIVENEGNVSLGVSHPELHIAITGIEKVVADEEAALAILEVLAPSATAQPLTSFSHFLGGPAKGQERHIVFVDNGRSEILKDERYRDVLRCIRCGACMNGCPVYRVAGGLSYGSPYMGPIGAVLSPLLWPDGGYGDLPGASSLCGRCDEVCPVSIPLHRMLMDLRADEVDTRRASLPERVAWKGWAATYSKATTAKAATLLGRGAQAALGMAPSSIRGRVPLAASRLSRDSDMLIPLHEAPARAAQSIPQAEPADLVALYTQRARELGISVVDSLRTNRGDRVVNASGAIASTGSVVLTGDRADRRPLLSAARVVVRLNKRDIVHYPSDAAATLGNDDAVILTGASRTADIEKQIVRGIHGAEEMIVVLK